VTVDSMPPPRRLREQAPKRCRYTIYKRVEAVPDEVFERCGRSRPSG
jgi:hypothetical protein